MKRMRRVVAVFSAVFALALLGALAWHSAGPAGSGRVGLQPEEMTTIVAGFKPKPTPTPNPTYPLYTFKIFNPGWRLAGCGVDLRNPSGGAIAEDPLCRTDSLGNGLATIRMPRGSIGFAQGYGVSAVGLNGVSRQTCRSDWRALNGGTEALLSCIPN